VPNNELFAQLDCDMDDAGWVLTDSTGQASIGGVWAAGNVRNPRAQVITAAGEASTAAIAINADLVDEDIRDAIRERRSKEAEHRHDRRATGPAPHQARHR
jgi:NADPH-dependent glutamate synthase beta subunit-like oxidoreductase